MQIDVRTRGEVDVVHVGTGTDVRSDGQGLHPLLQRLLAQGETLFILDLTQGPDLDDAWIGELIACQEEVQKHHGAIKLVLTPSQHSMTAGGRLEKRFETFRDEEDALDSSVPWYATSGIP